MVKERDALFDKDLADLKQGLLRLEQGANTTDNTQQQTPQQQVSPPVAEQMQQFKAYMSGLNIPTHFNGIFEQMLAGCPPVPVQKPVIATAQPPKTLAEEEAAVEEATRQSKAAAEAHAQKLQAAADTEAAAKAARTKEE